MFDEEFEMIKSFNIPLDNLSQYNKARLLHAHIIDDLNKIDKELLLNSDFLAMLKPGCQNELSGAYWDNMRNLWPSFREDIINKFRDQITRRMFF